MKRWPIIRHIRALWIVWSYIWTGASVWGFREMEDFDNFYQKDDERARRIWDGKE